MKVAGVMTGTSCDGLDAACLEFCGDNWRTLWTKSAHYPDALRRRVLEIQKPGAKLSLREFGELNRDLGAWYGKTLARFCAKNPPDAIASHGQTVAHFPAQGFTLQLGDPTRIAAATGLTVISNFRDGDMAMDGEGAPLAPRFHQLLAKQIAARGRVAIHNLGGISNLTYIGANGETIAFDTGPGNIWIDEATQLAGRGRFDRDGKLASSGTVDEQAVRQLLRDPFIRRKPPKSTGRDDFPFSALLAATRSRGPNLVATATAFTTETIVDAYTRFIIPGGLEAIYFCGGGAKNKSLLAQISKRLAPIQVQTLDKTGFDSKFLEAQAFAYFGYLALRGETLGGSWTGLNEWAPPAHVIPGSNWPRVIQKLTRETSTI